MTERNNHSDVKPYVLPQEQSDLLQEAQIPIVYHDEMRDTKGKLRVLSLFSGCGGMDLGFEGSFIANRKSFPQDSKYIDHAINKNWVMLKKKTKFKTVFANDILNEAEVAWIDIRKDALRLDALQALTTKEISDEYNPYPKPTHAATIKGNDLLDIVTTQDVLEGLKEPEETIDASQQLYSKAKFLTTGQGQTEIKLDNLGSTIRSEHHGNIEFDGIKIIQEEKYDKLREIYRLAS